MKMISLNMMKELQLLAQNGRADINIYWGYVSQMVYPGEQSARASCGPEYVEICTISDNVATLSEMQDRGVCKGILLAYTVEGTRYGVSYSLNTWSASDAGQDINLFREAAAAFLGQILGVSKAVSLRDNTRRLVVEMEAYASQEGWTEDRVASMADKKAAHRVASHVVVEAERLHGPREALTQRERECRDFLPTLC